MSDAKPPRPPGLLQRLADYLFGYDFFLSYSHGDGTNYPRQLCQSLQKAGFSVFLDQSDYVPGLDLRRETRRQVRKSKTLVVVARPRALKSEWVKREVDAALAQGHTPVIINVNRSVEAAPPDALLAKEALESHWLRLEEPIDQLDGPPSGHALSELIRGFKHTKQETLRVRAMGTAAVVFAAIAVVAGLLGWIAEVQRGRAARTVELATVAANNLVFKIEGSMKQRLNVPQDVTLAVLDQAELLTRSLSEISTPTPEVVRTGAVALLEIATVRREQGQATKAAELAQQAVDSFKGLLQQEPENRQFRADLANAYDRLGEALKEDRRTDAAFTAFQTCHDLASGLDREQSDMPEWQDTVALCSEKLGAMVADASNAGEAEFAKSKVLLDQNLKIRVSLAMAKTPDTLRNLAFAHERLAELAMKRGDAATSRDELEFSLDLIKPVASDNPGRSDLQRNLSVTYVTLGDFERDQNKLPAAIKYYRDYLAIALALAVTDTRDEWRLEVAQGQLRLAAALRDAAAAGGPTAADMTSEARKLAEAALALHLGNAGERAEWKRAAFSALITLGDEDQASGRQAEALTRLQAATDIALALVQSPERGSDMDAKLVATVRKSADAQVALGQRDAAYRLHETLLGQLDAITEAHPVKPATRAEALGNLAWYAMFDRKFDRAVSAAEHAHSLAPETGWIEINRADVLMLAGQTDAARTLYLAHNRIGDSKGAKWAELARGDFELLRKAGFNDPLMEEVDRLLLK